MFTTLIASAAIALSALAPAHTSHVVNGLRECTPRVHTTCVALADESTGRFIVRDSHGHAVHKRDGAAVLDYAKRKSDMCATEDASRCWWDAQAMGNGQGDSFVVVGNARQADGSRGLVWYLDNQE